MRRLMSMTDKKEGKKLLEGETAYHVSLGNIIKFTITRATNLYFYDDTRKYMRKKCFRTFEEAELKQLKLNIKFLGDNRLSILSYNETLTKLSKYQEYFI